MFYTVLLTQSRPVDLIRIEAFYSTLFFFANTTRIYKENNLFLYAVLCLVVFALSESVVTATREHLFNDACKIKKKTTVFGKCVVSELEYVFPLV